MTMSLDATRVNLDPEAIARDRALTFLPEPAPRPVWCPIISADDHALEPSTVFDRVSVRHRATIPRMIDVAGHPAWQVGDKRYFISGGEGVVGRPVTEWGAHGMRFEEFRRGVWDPDARLHDMDLNGVWASLNFSSATWGFAGTTLARLPDVEAGVACVRAYNDWVVEDWCGSRRDRLIPCQLPVLADPELAAREVLRNAERGVTAVSFSENTSALGFPSIYTDHWDPFLRACAETETVVNLHVGSSGSVHRPSPESPSPAMVTLFPLNGVEAIVDWIYAKVPIRFPSIKIAMSEAGVSWVPTVIERLHRSYRQRAANLVWSATEPHPVDVLHRNFWFTSIEDPSAFRLLDVIGEDHVMVEVDYPHADSSWPDSQALFRSQMASLPTATVKKVCFENAAALYQHPLPPDELLAGATLFAGHVD